MENRELTPEEEAKLLDEAEKAPTNINGAEVEVNERGLEFKDSAKTQTPNQGIEREGSEIPNQGIEREGFEIGE